MHRIVYAPSDPFGDVWHVVDEAGLTVYETEQRARAERELRRLNRSPITLKPWRRRREYYHGCQRGAGVGEAS